MVNNQAPDAAGRSGRRTTLRDVQADWRVLDDPDFPIPEGVRLISPVKFSSCPGIHVEHIRPCLLARVTQKSSLLSSIFHALKLIRVADKTTCIICVGGSHLERILGVLNGSLWRWRRKVFIVGPFVETPSSLVRHINRLMVKGATCSATWSRRSVGRIANYLQVEERHIVHIPYKANHTNLDTVSLAIGNYVFSGGNGRRDYRTLVDAVRGTRIPTIISTTEPERTLRDVDIPDNVIVVAAREPAFARLMAASRLVVFSIEPNTVRGGAAANILNAMWHCRPVIVGEEVQAPEYVIDGVTGYSVPPGDHEALRARITELWNASPVTLDQMGKAGHKLVRELYTHELFIRRVCRLGVILADA